MQAMASTLYPQLPVQQAWDMLLGEHVFSYAGSSGMLDEDKLGLVRVGQGVLLVWLRGTEPEWCMGWRSIPVLLRRRLSRAWFVGRLCLCGGG